MALSGKTPRKTVVVVGAGIVGVNTALEVQNRYPNFDVTLIADKFDGETLSDGAGGLFMPDTYIFGPDLETSQKWINDSYSFYKRLFYAEGKEPCGINEIACNIFSSVDSSFTKNHYMENCVSDFREATSDELKVYSSKNKIPIKFGSRFTTLVIECRLFLPWILEKISDNGCTVIKRKLESLEELYEEYDVVFNCTGLGAGKLCKDVNVLPIRGQVIRVKAPWVDECYVYDFDTYIIPWKDQGMAVLGGCRHFGSHDDRENKRNTEEILEVCTELVPSLKEILKNDYEVWVGLRPYRNQIRVEIERVGDTLIVHNYGHGGYGITLAPGTVKHAVNLLTSYLSSSDN